ncbi:MAG: type II toxin-antitoxin system death-on-curing family toxin [Patescibacteria group bacterium]|nr:type II toxin-antitoxin system death-on-curing family toxin [Patescibacteria group bacterium]
MTVRYLTAEEMAAIQQMLLEETGGAKGIRDFGLLFSLAEKPKTSFGGSELYPGIFMKAAVLLEALVNYHVFADGNKRTAFISAAIFLRVNGYYLRVKESQGLNFMLAVANKRKKLPDIAHWLKTYSVKT